MNWWLNPLVVVTFLPLIGVLLIALLEKQQVQLIRWMGLGTAVVTFGASLWLLAQFEVGRGIADLGEGAGHFDGVACQSHCHVCSP